MEFYVNGEKIDVSLEDEKTVGDVLKSFEIMIEQNNAAVIGISLNGEKISAETFDEHTKQPLKEDDTFEFTIVTHQMIFDSFKRLASLFKELAIQMEHIPVDLQTGRDKEVSTAIKNLADNIEEFCHIAALASIFDDYSEIKIQGMFFKDFFKDFSKILNDFEQALKIHDTVTVGDLAEYEICPRLIEIAKALENLL